MSYSILLTVGQDGSVEVTSASSGQAAPPPGTYAISGHVPTDDAPTGSVGVTTPLGGASAYIVGQ